MSIRRVADDENVAGESAVPTKKTVVIIGAGASGLAAS